MDVLFVIEQTERQYCTIQVDKAGEEISPGAAWTLRRIEMQFPEQEWWSSEKEREFRKSSAAFLLNLELKISDLDRSRIEHCASANEAIKTLHTKYFAVTYQASSETIRAFTSWTMDMKICPSDNWVKLHTIRRDAHRQMSSKLFDDVFTWNIFISGLRPREVYDTITDGFSHQMAEITKLQKLDEKWERLVIRQRKEKSFMASPHKSDTSSSDEALFVAYAKKMGYVKGTSQCFKCGSGKHLSIACIYAQQGFEFAKKLRIKAEGPESDEENRIYNPAVMRSKGNRFPSSSRARPSSRTRSPSPYRQRSPYPHKGKEAPDNPAKVSDKNVSFQKSAFVAEESSSDPDDEFAGISWEKRSEIPTVLAAADTGCTSHMTDQASLFTSALKPCRRSIRVGGGRLWSAGIGTMIISPGNERFVLLEDALFVPNLGCTLISARKLAASGCIGSFNKERMVFTRESNHDDLIEAKSKGGLYIVSNISKSANGMTFGNALYKEPPPRTTPTGDTIYSSPVIENVFSALDDEGSSLSENDDPTEVERISTHTDNLPRRERNKTYRQSRSRSPRQEYPKVINFTLKERRTQRELARYVYYHRRFCHASPKALSLLHTVCSIKKIIIPTQLPLCETCSRQKSRKRQSKKLAVHAQEPLALISFDVAGPFPTSYRGYNYFGEIVDNWTRKTWTLLLKDRKDVLPKLSQWKKEVELESGRQVKAVRTDNAPEILETLNLWNRADGISVQTTEPYTSAQNGVAERSIQSTENNVRAMIDDAELPVEFWCEAATAQAYVRARMRKGPTVTEEVLDKSSGEPLKVEYQISPQEAWSGKVPVVHNHIKAWGCKVIAHISRESLPGRQDKLMPTGREGVFMGYDEHTTSHHRLYAPDMHTTIVSSNVKFFEDIPGSSINNYQLWIELSDGSFEQSEGTYNKLLIRNKRGRPTRSHQEPTVDSIRMSSKEFEHEDDPEYAPLITPDQEEKLAKSSFSVVIPQQLAQETPILSAPTTNETREKEHEKDQLAAQDTPDLETKIPEHNSIERPFPNSRIIRLNSNKRANDPDSEFESSQEVKRLRSMIAVLDWFHDEEEPIELKEGSAMIASAAAHDILIPTNYKEAVNDPTHGAAWRTAINLEIGQLLTNNTWEEKVPPPDVNLISSKWVFTLKFNPDGTLERYKARLVARGFTQQYGVDYTETFAPTVRMATLRAFFAIVACEDLECRQYDIKNAFTESKLTEELWMKVPQGLQSVKNGAALHLLRSLYGLKQSARDWNLLMKSELLNWGFAQSKADPCLFVHTEKQIRLLVYVDDLAAAAPEARVLDWFYNKLNSRFNTKALGDVSKMLGIRVTRNRTSRTLELDQEQYLDKVLRKFGFANAVSKPITTPMDGYDDLKPGKDTDIRISATWYREVIGSLMYAMVYTRPDIAFALGRLSQYMQDPCEHHERAVKRLLRYTKSTISHRIRFGPDGKLVVYSDADFASNKFDRKSITATVGLIGGGPVFWASKKQSVVATATTEAEYIAMCFTAKQGQWVAQILRDLGAGHYIAPNHQTVNTKGDNQGAIALAKNPHLTERSKHIDISYHFIRDLQERKRADISYVPTAEMAADGLSKPLARKAFETFLSQIGMIWNRSST